MSASRPALVVLLALAPALAGCGHSPVAPATTYDARPLLQNVSHGVVAPTYGDLASQASALAGALSAFQASPDEPHLADARTAWRNARAPWEASEAFLYGPASDFEIDPALDSWPVNQVDVGAVLSSSLQLTPANVAVLAPEVQGFHTIEFVLFGQSGTRPASGFTARELQYLAALGTVLAQKAATLETSWAPSGDDFGRALYAPGAANPRYRSQADALAEVVGGMSEIADELAEGKITPAYDAMDPALEESRYSANSLADFRKNLASIGNVWRGSRDGSEGEGISRFVQEFDPAVDEEVRTKLAAAEAAVDAIPGSFSTAIVSARPAVAEAREKVRALRQALDERVRPLVAQLP